MTEAEITELFGARCDEFDAACPGCYVWRAYDDLAALRQRIAGMDTLADLVSTQAEDAGLWFCAETAAEAYLQDALRRLHHAIEGTPLRAQLEDVT